MKKESPSFQKYFFTVGVKNLTLTTVKNSFSAYTSYYAPLFSLAYFFTNLEYIYHGV